MALQKITTVVVGAGGAGAPLAARLSARPEREVILLEAGPISETPADLLDGSTIRGAVPGYRDNWVYETELAAGHPATIARGRVLGGSTTINGGYFVRATRADFARWAAAGGEAWSYDSVLPALRCIETDRDHGPSPIHGGEGPMPVVRPPQTAPASAAFIAGAQELGLPLEEDKNAQGMPGVGAVTSNTVNGERINTGVAYRLQELQERGQLTVHPHTRVTRIVWDGCRARGVEVIAQGHPEDSSTTTRIIWADEIVLAAGAISTPHILLVSGVGPRDQLDALGIPLVADLPVGTAFCDHPNLALTWHTKPGVIDRTAPFAFPTALNFDAASADPTLASRPEGDIEILLTAKPLEYLLTGSDSGEDVLQLLIALQEHSGRGRLSLRSSDPMVPPRVEYRYLTSEDDRRRMRAGVRTAVQLLRSHAFKGVFDRLGDLADATLTDDDRLDQWVLNHLGTALHTCGTAPMGSVVDGEGRILGVDGLRIADTSILPSAPHRGPANTAVLIGELIARAMP